MLKWECVSVTSVSYRTPQMIVKENEGPDPLKSMFWIRVGFNEDLDPVFYLNADPGSGS
jgi:hypothetical protein